MWWLREAGGLGPEPAWKRPRTRDSGGAPVAGQGLLGDRGHVAAGAVEDPGGAEAPGVGHPPAPKLEEQPFVGAERPVEPDRMVEAGREHPLPVRHHRMGAERGAERELV